MNTKALTLLYVEDEIDTCEELLDILQLDFKEVIVGHDGLEGLTLYKEHQPDFVLTDVQMPRMDGIEMSIQIMVFDPEAKIIVMTAFNEEPFREYAKSVGAIHYVPKPIDINELYSCIDACIKG